MRHFTKKIVEMLERGNASEKSKEWVYRFATCSVLKYHNAVDPLWEPIKDRDDLRDELVKLGWLPHADTSVPPYSVVDEIDVARIKRIYGDYGQLPGVNFMFIDCNNPEPLTTA